MKEYIYKFCNEEYNYKQRSEYNNHDVIKPTPVTKTIDSIYAIRKLGRDYCQTEGSAHYKSSTIEPAEYAMANGKFEDWAVTNVVKYITRFGDTRNKDDLKKVADFAHLLCGVEINKENKGE